MTKKTWVASMVGCALMGSALGSVGLSFADNVRSTSNLLDSGVVLPYEGYLMLDSAPVNKSDQQVRFSLYESASGGTAQWVEGQTVSVVNGKFAVALGSDVNNKVSSSPANATFSDVILDAQKLYIGIEVMNDQGQFVELSGRQEIQPAPYAAWSARSADFKAEGGMVIEGVTRPQNGIVMRDNTSISGVGQVIGPNELRLSGSSTATRQVVVDADGDVVVGRDLSTTRNLSVSGDADVVGDTTITGNAGVTGSTSLHNTFINGTANVTGDTTLSGGVSVSGAATFGSDVTMLGTLYGGVRYSSPHVLTSSSTTSKDLLITPGEGICFLIRMEIDHAGDDISPQGCSVDVNVGKWTLNLKNNTGNSGSITCAARCLIGPRTQ